MLSIHDDQNYVLCTFCYGALAHLLTESNANELVQVIQAAMNRRHWSSAPLVEHVIVANLHPDLSRPTKRYESLSAREQQVLELVGKGCTNAELALALGVNKGTVETYRRRLKSKMGRHSQAEVLQFAGPHELPHRLLKDDFRKRIIATPLLHLAFPNT